MRNRSYLDLGAVVPKYLHYLLSKSGPISISDLATGEVTNGVLHHFAHSRIHETGRILSSFREIHEFGAIIDSVANSRCPVRK